MLCLLCVTPLVCHLTQGLPRLHLSAAADDRGIVSYLNTHLFSKVLHQRRRVSPRRPMNLLIVGSDYCVMRLAYALHMRRQSIVLLSCLYTEPFELVIKIVSTTAQRLSATKLICLKVHSGAATLSASMMRCVDR